MYRCDVSVILFEFASCCMSPDLCHMSVIQFLCCIFVVFCSGALSHFLPLFWWQSGVYYSILLRFSGASGDIVLCYDFLLQSCNRIFCLKSNITNRIDQQSFIHVFSLIFSYFLTFHFFYYTIIIFIIVYTIIISRPMIWYPEYPIKF